MRRPDKKFFRDRFDLADRVQVRVIKRRARKGPGVALGARGPGALGAEIARPAGAQQAPYCQP